MKTLREIREEMKTLESEKASLLEELEVLKTKVEQRRNRLLEEVEALRKEVKAFKELTANP